jgi:Plasmid pRiA4b ORF-3-like protein
MCCPPEDVGGIPGFYDFLEAITDPRHPDHDERVEWHGGPFDPHYLDRDRINTVLNSIAARRQRASPEAPHLTNGAFTERLRPARSMYGRRNRFRGRLASLVGERRVESLLRHCGQLPLARGLRLADAPVGERQRRTKTGHMLRLVFLVASRVPARWRSWSSASKCVKVRGRRRFKGVSAREHPKAMRRQRPGSYGAVKAAEAARAESAPAIDLSSKWCAV